MDCTKHLFNLEWEHHSWRPRVTGTDSVPTQDTNMWGRTVYSHYCRCHKEDVCEVCGAVRRNRSCFCDTAEGDACAIRLDWLNESHDPGRPV